MGKATALSSFVLPFTLSERPTCNDPERDHENEQHRSWTDSHERLQHEARVEVDAVQGAYGAGARVREQLGVQKHHSERVIGILVCMRTQKRVGRVTIPS